MPLTPLHQTILRDLLKNRSPDSYLARGTAIHRKPESPQISQDVDIFHDVMHLVEASALKDAETLERLGYQVDWKMKQEGFYRAVVTTQNKEAMKIEWAHDSCYRFFPVKPDKKTGHRLHQADLATNKVLAAAGRMVPRDYVDCLFLHQSYCSLGALIWAASAKDDELPPELILDFLKRNSRYTKEQLEDEITWAVPFEPERMKEQWMQACEEAAALLDWLPPKDKGCLYLSKAGKPATPTPDTIGRLQKHFAQPKGAWPKISTISKGRENPSDP